MLLFVGSLGSVLNHPALVMDLLTQVNARLHRKPGRDGGERLVRQHGKMLALQSEYHTSHHGDPSLANK